MLDIILGYQLHCRGLEIEDENIFIAIGKFIQMTVLNYQYGFAGSFIIELSGLAPVDYLQRIFTFCLNENSLCLILLLVDFICKNNLYTVFF